MKVILEKEIVARPAVSARPRQVSFFSTCAPSTINCVALIGVFFGPVINIRSAANFSLGRFHVQTWGVLYFIGLPPVYPLFGCLFLKANLEKEIVVCPATSASPRQGSLFSTCAPSTINCVAVIGVFFDPVINIRSAANYSLRVSCPDVGCPLFCWASSRLSLFWVIVFES